MNELGKQIETHARDMKARYAERDSMYDEIEDMYLLKWDEEAAVQREMENVKITISPDARNAAQGAMRLLTATDPVWSVPVDEQEVGADVSEDIEKMCEVVWSAAGRVSGDPIHYDAVRSGVLFSEIFLGVTSTKDLEKYAESGNTPALQERAKQVAAMTPYLFEVYDPRTCYPETDILGLRAFYREYTTTIRTAKDQYGEANVNIKDQNLGDYDEITIGDYWDMEWRQVWIIGEDEPIIQEKHKLPFIPVVAQIVEGSKLFEEEDEKRQPFLFTVWKSGLWKRLNLANTVLWTNVFSIGANPLFIHEQGDQNAEVDYDFDTPGGVATVPPGSKFYPMLNKGITDPGVLGAMELANNQITESTIYKQTLGEPLGGNPSFSMTALLSQSGRLPLVVTQRKASWAIADAMKIAIRWLKHEKEERKATYAGVSVALDAESIPEVFELEAKLDIALPQDKLQQANVAGMLTGGDDPLVSKQWAREEVLNIGQSEAMTKQIWNEQAEMIYYRQFIQEQIIKMQMQQQQMEQMAMQRQMQQQQQQMGGQPGQPPGQPGPMPPPGAPPPGMEGQMPPGMQPPGQPGMQGLPPEMAQGGAQGPLQPGYEQQGLPPAGPLPPEEV